MCRRPASAGSPAAPFPVARFGRPLRSLGADPRTLPARRRPPRTMGMRVPSPRWTCASRNAVLARAVNDAATVIVWTGE